MSMSMGISSQCRSRKQWKYIVFILWMHYMTSFLLTSARQRDVVGSQICSGLFHLRPTSTNESCFKLVKKHLQMNQADPDWPRLTKTYLAWHSLNHLGLAWPGLTQTEHPQVYHNSPVPANMSRWEAYMSIRNPCNLSSSGSWEAYSNTQF